MAGYASLFQRVNNQSEAIEKIVSGLTDKQIRYTPQPGKWSIHDNITHLTRYQPIFLERMKSILVEDDLLFKRYVPEQDPGFEECRAMQTLQLLTNLRVVRAEIYSFITELTDELFARRASHSVYGKLTIAEWTEFFLLHEAHHILTIFKLAKDANNIP